MKSIYFYALVDIVGCVSTAERAYKLVTRRTSSPPTMKLCTRTSVEMGLLQILFIFQVNEACLDLLVRSFNQIFTPVIETSENRIHKSHRVDDLTKFYKRDDSGNFVLRDDKWLSANPFVKNTKTKDSKKVKRRYKPTGRSLFEHLNMEARSVPDEDDASEYNQWMDYYEQDEFQTAQHPKIVNDSNATSESNASIPKENIEFTGFGKSMYNEEAEDDKHQILNGARKIQLAAQDYDFDDDYPEIDNDLYSSGDKPKYYIPGHRPIVDFLIKLLEMFQVGLEATPNYIAPHSKDKKTKKDRSSNDTEYLNETEHDDRRDE